MPTIEECTNEAVCCFSLSKKEREKMWELIKLRWQLYFHGLCNITSISIALNVIIEQWFKINKKKTKNVSYGKPVTCELEHFHQPTHVNVIFIFSFTSNITIRFNFRLQKAFGFIRIIIVNLFSFATQKPNSFMATALKIVS